MFAALRILAPAVLLATSLSGPAAAAGVLVHLLHEHAAPRATHTRAHGDAHRHDGRGADHGLEHDAGGEAADHGHEHDHGGRAAGHGHGHEGDGRAPEHGHSHERDDAHGDDHSHDLALTATFAPARGASAAPELLPAFVPAAAPACAPAPERLPERLAAASGRAAPAALQRRPVLRN